MPSSKFVQKARKIAEKNPEVFNTLMEFEKTKKIKTKTRLNFTIDKEVAMKFKKNAREKGYNMSAKIEQAMKSIIESK
jgi:hypothetical protein